jgi:hypothetical protein
MRPDARRYLEATLIDGDGGLKEIVVFVTKPLHGGRQIAFLLE